MRLGKDWPAIERLTYWRNKEVSKYMMHILASYENFQHVSFLQRWGVEPSRIQKSIGNWMAGTINPSDTEAEHLRGVMAFRAATKTAIGSNFCAWLTLLDPRISVKVVSGKDDYAQKITKECRIWYDVVDFLKDSIHPELNHGTSTMLDNAKSFNVLGNLGGKDNSFSAVAIGGNITSSRAHIILMDDIEYPKNCDTPGKREKLKGEDAEANNILFSEKACVSSGILYNGFKPFKLYLGTPHTEESIYTLKQTQGYQFRIWPARYPNEKFRKNIGSLVSPDLLEDMRNNPSITTGYGLDLSQGKLIDPQRQSDEDLLQKEVEEGSAGWAKQYMLDVTLQNQGKYPLKLRDLIVVDLDAKVGRGSYLSERSRDFVLSDVPCVGLPGDRFYRPSYYSDDVFPYEEILMAVDTSGRGADETTYAVGASLNGNIFLLDSGGFAGYDDGYGDDVLKALANLAKRWNISAIDVETNFGDGMFTKLLTPILQEVHKCTIRETRALGQKEVRIIETLEKVMARRKLIVNKNIIQRDYDNVPGKARETEKPTYRLFYQMARITRNRGALVHDDRLDSVEILVRKLSNALEITQTKAEALKLKSYYRNLKAPNGVFQMMGHSAPKSSSNILRGN